MIDINEVKKQAEQEVREENSKKAKETIKALLRKKEQASQVLSNIDRELADAYAELGRGNS